MTATKPIDIRGKLPVHTERKWARRALSDIRGVVFHQAAGVTTAIAAARYHIGPNHLSPDGCPGICYTIFVEPDGQAYLCNDFEDITWSQGSGVVPIEGTRGNTNYVSVCFGGDFSGPGYPGHGDPTKAQIETAGKLWAYLRDTLKLAPDALYGHFDFGKPACPGTVLCELIGEIRIAANKGLKLPESVKEWQSSLVKLGYDLGTNGKGKDGVDGDWGPMSRAALVSFQRSRALPLTGYRDGATALEIGKAIEESVKK